MPGPFSPISRRWWKADHLRSPQYRLFSWSSVLILFILLGADILSSLTTITPALAASHISTQVNPALAAPAWLNPSTTASTKPDLGQYVAPAKPLPTKPVGVQPRVIVSMQPARLQVTAVAQHFVSSDGQLLVDIAAGTLSASQLAQQTSGIWLYISQVQPGSGGLSGNQITFGSYEFQWFDGTGKPLTTIQLLHPLTIHFHMRSDQAPLVVKGQPVYTIWNTVQGASAAPALATKAATTNGAQSVLVPAVMSGQKSVLSYAQSDNSGLDWSVQSSLVPSPPVASATSTADAKATPQTTAFAAQSSTATYGTTAPQASWGKPTDFQVGLNSGGLNYSYPLSVPPGSGGLAPSLSLNYSSGSVDENTAGNRQPPGWVRVGAWIWARLAGLRKMSCPTGPIRWRASGISVTPVVLGDN